MLGSCACNAVIARDMAVTIVRNRLIVVKFWMNNKYV